MFRDEQILEAKENMENHLKEVLQQLSIIYPKFNTNDTHNLETPHRIMKALVEMNRGLGVMDFKFTTFPNDNYGTLNGWIVKKNIEFSSLCQHHFMPFTGKVHIGYVPCKTICGISKLDRVVNYFSKRPQVQENLGKDIHDFIKEKLHPIKLVVVIESLHTCVACRGIESRNSTMITTHSNSNSDVLEFKELIR